MFAALLVRAVSLVVTAISFQPDLWLTFGAATVAVAVIYAMIGVLLGPLIGRIGGRYLRFLLPFLDVGLAQNVVFSAAPPSWAAWMPAHGAVRVLIDGAFTTTFDETNGLLLAGAWIVGLSVVAALVFHRLAASRV